MPWEVSADDGRLVLTVARFEDQTSFTVPTVQAMPRGRFWSLLVVRQGRFSSLRCGDSTLTRSSATTEGARIEVWTSSPSLTGTCAFGMTSYNLPCEGWPDCWEEHGTHVGSADPVTIRVGIYQPNDDPDGFSIALCTSGGQPILLDERAARELSELLIWSADVYRHDVRCQQRWRQAAARDLVDGAVLNRDEWSQLLAAVTAGEKPEPLVDLLTACAPARWVADKPTAADGEER